MTRIILALLSAALLAACDQDGGSPVMDSATDTSGTDSAAGDTAGDPGSDPGTDTSMDTTVDSRMDPGTDPGSDPTSDTGVDPGTDGTSGGAGCTARDTPGCGGCPCEGCVCEIEPHCCELFWDDACVWDCQFICGFDC
jgi:hypothetical protein